MRVLRGWAVEAVLDELEVQGLNKRCQSWKLEMMLCIQACYREKLSKFWPLLQNFLYPFTPLHHSGALSDFSFCGKDRDRAKESRRGMAARGGLCLGFKVCPAHPPFNERSCDPVRGVGGRLTGIRGLGPLFWSRTSPQNKLVWGRLPHGPGCPPPPLGPLPPLMLGAGTWKEASDYFIAGFRAASGAVLSNVALGRVSLCFD